ASLLRRGRSFPRSLLDGGWKCAGTGDLFPVPKVVEPTRGTFTMREPAEVLSGPTRKMSMAAAETSKPEVDKELTEIRKEVIEARNLVIKTDNLLKNLHAE